jgi:hypothetical protein
MGEILASLVFPHKSDLPWVLGMFQGRRRWHR